MELSLSKTSWKVMGYWPFVPLFDSGAESGDKLMAVTEWIAASVPGGVHLDLLKTGLIEDPYFELNSLKCEWVENRWWLYRTSFRLPSEFGGRNLSLVFKGLDCRAYIYLNGFNLGEHEGMFEPAVFDITQSAGSRDKNVLEVLFENAPDEMSQIGMTSRVRTTGSISIAEPFLRSSREDGNGRIFLGFFLEGKPQTRGKASVKILSRIPSSSMTSRYT